jgi:hypothetical protein
MELSSNLPSIAANKLVKMRGLGKNKRKYQYRYKVFIFATLLKPE